MHQDPHADEIVGATLVRSSAAMDYFPGASKAAISFVERDVPGTDQMFDEAGKLPIGCGGEVRFNDHRGPDGRVKGECAATLVAKYIEVYGLPQYERLLAETLWNDCHSGTKRTQLSEIVKAANRHMRNNSLAIVSWGIDAVDAIIEREKWGYAAVGGEMTLLQVFQAYRSKVAKDSDPATLDWLQKAMVESEANETKLVTELSYIVGALFRRLDPTTRKPAKKVSDVIEWCTVAFNALYASQMEFREEQSMFAQNPPRQFGIQAEIHRQDRTLKLLSFQSDSRASLQVALSMGADVVLVRDSQGHARINTRKGLGLNLANVMRMIRFLESQGAEKKPTHGSWTELGHGGEHQFAPWWYYDVQAQAIYNGTETHEVVPTKIATQALIEILLFGFHPDGIIEWREKRNIFLNRGRHGELFWTLGVRHFRSRRASKDKPVAAGTNNIVEAFAEAKPLEKPAKSTAVVTNEKPSRKSKAKGEKATRGGKKQYNRAESKREAKEAVTA